MRPVALSIAGSDSSGGAGMQADLRAFTAFGVDGTSAVTAVTAQTPGAVLDVHVLPSRVVAAQLDAVLAGRPVSAVKTGMLASRPVVEVVHARAAAALLPNLVVDPVLVASAGRRLLPAAAIPSLRRLAGLATVVTPNLAEAAALAGCEGLDDPWEAAVRLARLGPAAVVVTGGDQGDGDCVDVAWFDGTTFELRGPRIRAHDTHGTGCAFSSALAALLARGDEIPTAIAGAKAYVGDVLAGRAGRAG